VIEQVPERLAKRDRQIANHERREDDQDHLEEFAVLGRHLARLRHGDLPGGAVAPRTATQIAAASEHGRDVAQGGVDRRSPGPRARAGPGAGEVEHAALGSNRRHAAGAAVVEALGVEPRRAGGAPQAVAAVHRVPRRGRGRRRHAARRQLLRDRRGGVEGRHGQVGRSLRGDGRRRRPRAGPDGGVLCRRNVGAPEVPAAVAG